MQDRSATAPGNLTAGGHAAESEATQLMARARDEEHRRDEELARYHNYEFASAIFQIGIVLASAEVITGITALGWLSGLLGLVGLGLTSIGLWAPHALDFLLHAGHGAGAH